MIVFNKLFFQYSLSAILLLFSISSIAQKKNKDVYSNFVIGFLDSMNKKGIDTILTGDYNYNNGIDTLRQFFFWKEKGKGRLLILRGSEDDFSTKIIYNTSLERDLAFFKNHRLDTMHSAIKTTGYQSHDYGWELYVKTKNQTFYVTVLDWEKKNNPADIRCVWVNSIEEKMKKYW